MSSYKVRPDWVVAMFCDYGHKDRKTLLRASYSLTAGEGAWKKFNKAYSKNGYRCWQEDVSGKILRDSNNAC